MLLLTSTSDIIRIVTGSAADIDVHASWVDNASGTITPGRLNTTAVTTATTATVVTSPAGSTQRNVKHINITNVHATVASTVTVQHYDGTTNEDLMGVNLLPGENLIFDETGNWSHRDIQGAMYSYQVPANQNLGLTGCLSETIPREICTETNTTMGASGVLNLMAIKLTAGMLVSNITIASATTAASSPTHYWFALYGPAASRTLLASSADQTSTAWAATTVKTLAMTTPYRVPTTGQYYIGYAMVASTVPTIKGNTARTGGQLAGSTPIIAGPSSTGITTALPDPAAAITGTNTITWYAAVS